MSQIAHQDSGMVLLCGPTGSGKTTTLYALLREIDASVRNVVTIEDPIEYRVEGVTQLPINAAQGNSFSALLRSVLRQDPDVILVGEIRDPETATIALQAATTGHLVLSTVHSRDTTGTLYRLLNLGVEPYMLATGLNLVVAQRLVRQLCPHCKRTAKPTPEQTDRLAGTGARPGQSICTPVGCEKCLQTAYLGRRAAFETLTITDTLRDVVLSSPQIQNIRRAREDTTFVSLQQTIFQMVADGITAFEEVERVVGAD
jgi:general secretion pathway protein E